MREADRMYHAIHALMMKIAENADLSPLHAEMFQHLIPQNAWDEARLAAYAYYKTHKDQYFMRDTSATPFDKNVE